MRLAGLVPIMNPSFPPRRENARVRPPEVPGLRTLTSMVAGVIALCALYFGRAVLMPITLAVLLSFLLAPFATALRRVGFRHVPSVIAAVLVALSMIAATGVLIGAQVAQLAGDLPRYQAAFEHKAQVLHEETIGRADALLRRASGALNHVAPPRDDEANPERSASPSDHPPMPVEVHEPTPSPLRLMQRFASPMVSPLETAGIVAVVAIFILLQREDLRDRLIRLFGARDLHRTTTAMDEAARRLSRYVLAQAAINTGVGALACVGLAIIGVPGALLFGVVTALARFVPYAGAWIAGLLAVLLAAAVGPGWWMAVWTAILFVTVELAAGQFVEPLLYGNSTGLSPFAVIVSALFWSWIWGPVGLVLSTPLTLCLVTLGRHVERVEFLDVLFGDHPVLASLEGLDYEIVCVDDGSRDATLAKLQTARRRYGKVKLVELSRNFGKESALTAGLDESNGDVIVPFDADLQDPPEVIPRLVEKWRQGYDVVLAQRVDRNTDTFAKRKTAAMFYRVHNALAPRHIPENVGDFRLFTREVLEALKLLPERQRFMKGLFAWVGFRSTAVECVRDARVAGRTRFSGWKLWNFALEGFTSFSTLPLRVWTYVGSTVAAFAVLYGAFIVVRTLLKGNAVPGYASLASIILFLGGIQLIGIGVIGEYLGRVYFETKQRPATT